MKAVILAGGLGKRMGKLSEEIPKPMTLINKKPVLQHQLEVLKKEGISDFIFVTGYLSEKIEEYFKDGSTFGVTIEYFCEKEPLGTAGALFKLRLEEDFLLCNGDLIFDFSFEKMLDFHRKNNALATLFSHPNSHPYDSTLIEAKENGQVTGFISGEKPESYQNLCNAGIQLISPSLLQMYNIESYADLDKDIIRPAVNTGRIYAYKSAEYVKDMGTPERLKAVTDDVVKGVVQRRHSSVMQKAVFLDRDGTINKHKGFITDPSEIELVENAGKAVANINKKGYLAIIVTNQPVIARGECTEEKLREIHNRLETLLGEQGAYIDGIYYCPHHPDKGFQKEVEELKISCSCRKPQPGMLLQAKEDFNIDLAESYMVGDSQRDVEAGENAGCKSVLLSEERSLYDFSLSII